MFSVKRLLSAAVLVVMPLFFNSSVQAEVIGKLIRPYMSYSMTADDNILRIRDQMDAEALLGTNNLFDISHRFLGGAVIDKQISRQQLHFNGNWSHNRYEKFSQINNNAFNLQGNWNWFLGNRLEGNLGANFDKSLAPFLFQPAIKNVRSQHTEYFNFAWHYHPSWRLRGDYTHFDFQSDNVLLRFQNRREDRFETGIDYLASSGSSVGLQYRHIRGKFTTPIQTITENDYNQNEVKGRIDWKLSGKSHLRFLGGWVERNNASFSTSDFNGFNARMTYLWKPTGKIGITLSGWRETVAIQSLSANFSLNTGGSATTVWQFSEKTKLQGYFSYLTQKFDRFSVFTNRAADFSNNNKIFTASLELTYAPFHGTELSTAAVHNSLSSNSSLGGFTANGVTVSLRYILGNQ
ncbi:XrtB/PEP-CTERM-associated polysaccharide biosynthesis outer membrane protein EpsL [Nitrosomonas sp.]|uniref:XrtB/PEP-CTERM-associated polysaccharide biosynthesis outer membrane protein EpsL n=1 Tax=Nitrosomonas sp. TaxID=42353 RepID=UPI00284D62B0|nr:XrtB/PEP-CTERM-associated polysaccharide biosynthesis outer membrane protein EpsL [Nitrosomonas sp.]MDR4513100.1 hypothetical protein [Nitrosomonas sp.]